MPFRLEHITLADRMALGCTCLLSAGEYGRVTALADRYGTSRPFLYALRDRTRTALALALAPGAPGRRPPDHGLVVDRLAIERAVLVLNQVAHASVRSIQECLREILAVDRSVGAIQAVLATAARRARALQPVPRHPLHAVADEVFAAGRPVRAVVDHPTGLVVALEAGSQRDETAWGCTFLELAAREVAVASVTADGAEGLRAGARAAGLPVPHLDHWHTLRDLGRLSRQGETAAYRRLAEAERCQRAAAAERYREQHGQRPRRGRPLKAATDPASVATVVRAAEAAIDQADGMAYLLAAVRDALRPLAAHTYQVRRPAQAAADLSAASALLRELGGAATEAATLLEQRALGLLTYLEALEQALAGPRTVLSEAELAFLAWAWQHRARLGLQAAADAWPQAPAVAAAVWAALDGAVRASGLVENLNSILAPHRASHRGLSALLLPVCQVYRNHRVFPRGKRAGHSPLELAGLPSPHWLDALGYGRSAAPVPCEFPTDAIPTVNTLAA